MINHIMTTERIALQSSVVCCSLGNGRIQVVIKCTLFLSKQKPWFLVHIALTLAPSSAPYYITQRHMGKAPNATYFQPKYGLTLPKIKNPRAPLQRAGTRWYNTRFD